MPPLVELLDAVGIGLDGSWLPNGETIQGNTAEPNLEENECDHRLPPDCYTVTIIAARHLTYGLASEVVIA
jgi:hypothetical protein